MATTKKNSKYDDTNYLVDYSGKQNKIRKCEEGHTLDVVKQANSNYERLLVSDYTKNSRAQSSCEAGKRTSRKRSAKAQKKAEKQVFAKSNKVSESLVLDKIKEIKIDQADILNLTRNPSGAE